jgi:hypothetical protein
VQWRPSPPEHRRETEIAMNATFTQQHPQPSETHPQLPHAQLRALYLSLLQHQEHFDEFKQRLALYKVAPEASSEPEDAAKVRDELNQVIQTWVGGVFEGLSAAQVLQWRAIVVEERFNVSLSPWKESNMY